MDLSRDTQRRKINWVAGAALSKGIDQAYRDCSHQMNEGKTITKVSGQIQRKNQSMVLWERHILRTQANLCLVINFMIIFITHNLLTAFISSPGKDPTAQSCSKTWMRKQTKYLKINMYAIIFIIRGQLTNGEFYNFQVGQKCPCCCCLLTYKASSRKRNHGTYLKNAFNKNLQKHKLFSVLFLAVVPFQRTVMRVKIGQDKPITWNLMDIWMLKMTKLFLVLVSFPSFLGWCSCTSCEDNWHTWVYFLYYLLYIHVIVGLHI